MKRLGTVADKDLVNAVRKRDEQAARELYDRYIDRVHSVCYRILLDRSMVLDCVQEVWLKFFRSLETIEVKGDLKSWVTRIAVNTAIDTYRKRKTSGSFVDLEDDHLNSIQVEEPVSTENMEEEEVKEIIMNVLEKLSVSQRTAFVLRYFEEVPNKDIAEILGCTQGTVRSHIRRSILALRKRLSKDLQEYMTS